MCLFSVMFGWRFTQFYQSHFYLCMGFLDCRLNNPALVGLMHKLHILEACQFLIMVIGSGAGLFFVNLAFIDSQIGIVMAETELMSLTGLALLVMEWKCSGKGIEQDKPVAMEVSMEELKNSS